MYKSLKSGKNIITIVITVNNINNNEYNASYIAAPTSVHNPPFRRGE